MNSKWAGFPEWRCEGNAAFANLKGLRLRLAARGSWLVARGSWLVARGSWLVARGSWLVARGSWLVARGSW
ncbi:MAG: hypothetical protein O9274_05370, partial [Limnobacter sp.]|nr:hypothetical protein [Limnobacter sp.]